MKLSFVKFFLVAIGVLIVTFIFTFSTFAAERTVKFTDLPSVDYTLPSLANPHVIRIGEIQARHGRVAVLERVYDVSGSSAIQKKLLDQAVKVFKKGANNVSEADIVPLVTSEKVLHDAKKFKQRLRVWEVNKPKQPIFIDVPPVFDVSTPQVVNPLWVLGEKEVTVLQDSADHHSSMLSSASFKTKKLKKIGMDVELSEFPTIDDVFGAIWSRMEGKESIENTVERETDEETELSYTVGTFTIIDAKGNVTVARYPIGDYEYDDEDTDDTSSLNPLILELGSAGFYLQTYTAGMFVVQQGVTTTENIMNNQMPDDISSLDQVKKLIHQQWAKPESNEFATYQVLGYRLRK